MPKEYETLLIDDNDRCYVHTVIITDPAQDTDEHVLLAAMRWFETHHGAEKARDTSAHITKRPK